MVRVKIVFGLLVAVGVFASSANAHGIFKKQMESKMPGMKISCNACHVDKQPKTERNALGKLFSKHLTVKDQTKVRDGKSGADRKKYETEVMGPDFLKAYKAVEGLTLAEMATEGLLGENITKKEEK